MSLDDEILHSLSAELAAFCEHHARESLSQPPLDYGLEGRRLLTQSRRALARISFLALSLRLREERVFLERLAFEIEAVCALPDWNPSHFLDVG